MRVPFGDVFVLLETKEFRWLVAARRIKSMENLPQAVFGWRRFVPFANKSKLRQEFSVKLSCHRHVFHSQIDMIKATRFHFMIFNWFASQFNCL